VIVGVSCAEKSVHARALPRTLAYKFGDFNFEKEKKSGLLYYFLGSIVSLTFLLV